MGVDGIGSGGRRPVGGVEPPGVGAAHEVAADATPELEGAARADAPAGATALQKLERGEIDLDRYLDARVADAVHHLEGRLPETQMDFIRRALREELASDPVLVELVRRTTGSLPTPRAD